MNGAPNPGSSDGSPGTATPPIPISAPPPGVVATPPTDTLQGHAVGRILPYGAARTLGAVGPFLLQAILCQVAGPATAGRFFFLASAALFLALVADLGAGNAFPVLWGSRPGRAAPELADILAMRQAVALAGIGGLAGLSAAGLWNQMTPRDALLIGVFVCARTALTARQGRLYSFQQFGPLARCGVWHAGGLGLGLALAVGTLGPTPVAGMLALIGGTLSELAGMAAGGWLRLAPDLPPPSAAPLAERLRLAGRRLAPFALAGVAAAFYQRSDAFVGDRFLDADSLGLYGTTDAFYRLAIAPVYLSGQAVYPAIRAACEEGRPGGVRREVGHHLRAGALLASLGLAGFAVVTQRSPGAVASSPFWWPFFVAIPIAVPAALVAPLLYSRGLAAPLAGVAVITGLARPLVAALAIGWVGPAGLALTHLALDAGQTTFSLTILPRWAARVAPGDGSEKTVPRAP